MRIERDDSSVSWEEVAILFHAVGWGKRDPHVEKYPDLWEAES
jgi:hypothetical protein